ncbi:MAG: hypothetical protein QOF83_420 [Solirubrobacteraceae bacterium]|jgi:short subunit dehydrogenase-like uncharacterized protein|nr:hypothetical protein [Solirubrobacteraceae bacterium]
MAGRIVVFGATGYTGEMTARALVARGAKPILAARSAERLERLADQLGGLETRTADVTRPETVRALVQDRDVLISTVGPFLRWGAPAIEAAIDAGAVYIDSSGEPAFTRRVFEHYGRQAEGTGASLLTAFGYDWVPGNLAGALALSEAREEATRIQIGYFGQGAAGRSGGTQASLISALLEPSFAFRGGRLRTERLGARVRKFNLGDSRPRLAISVGASEHLTLPARHPKLQQVDVLLGMDGAYVRYMPVISALIAGATTLPLAGTALKTLLWRQAQGSTGGPDEAARSRSSSAILATAYAADGRELNAVRLEGVNTYTFGFEMLAWAAMAAQAGNVNAPGALGPVGAFGLDELETGVRAAGIARMQ